MTWIGKYKDILERCWGKKQHYHFVKVILQNIAAKTELFVLEV